MSVDVVSPLRQRMIEDMTARKLGAGTQRLHISSCKRFAAFLKRSPDAATVEDIRRFQLHLAETGTSIPNRNRIMTGLRFLFRVTLRRLDLVAEIYPRTAEDSASDQLRPQFRKCRSEVMGQQHRCREDNDDNDRPWVEKPHRK
jgi:hypothetical protein